MPRVSTSGATTARAQRGGAHLGQLHQPRRRDLARVVPAHPLRCAARGGAATYALSLVRRRGAQGASQLGGIDFEHRRTAGRRPDLRARLERDLPRRERPAGVARAELARRAGRRVDHRHAAGHRLQRRQAEALTAVGQHDDVGGAVQRGKLVRRQVVRHVEHRRDVGACGKRSHCAPGRLAAVRGLDADVLHDEPDVVARAERLRPRGEQDVDPLAPDRPAAEQERASGVRSVERPCRAVRREALERDAVRHDVDDPRRHPAGDIAVAHERTRHPHAVEALARCAHPRERRGTELPRKDRDRWPVGAGGEVRRPAVRDRRAGDVEPRAARLTRHHDVAPLRKRSAEPVVHVRKRVDAAVLATNHAAWLRARAVRVGGEGHTAFNDRRLAPTLETQAQRGRRCSRRATQAASTIR